MSLLNVLLTGTQVVSGAHGLRGWIASARSTPAEWSLCATVVRTGSPYVVTDLAADPRHADNPLCTVDGLRSYAGVPLRDLRGHVLGALCVLDTRPRQYSRDDLTLLRQLADRSMARLVVAAQQDASG
jgi:GAF domain-containing protein